MSYGGLYLHEIAMAYGIDLMVYAKIIIIIFVIIFMSADS
jgi:hypothetical protein